MRRLNVAGTRLGLLIVLSSLILSSSGKAQSAKPPDTSQDRSFSGRLNETPQSDKPRPVRNDAPQPADEVVTLRYFKIKKGSFDQFLRASVEGVWPYFEKIGSRVIGMWQVVNAEGIAGGPQASKDFDEVYLSTRYASLEHWKATRDAVSLGGNGPDWEKCKAALALRQSLTISSNVIFLKGQMAPGGPYFLPGLNETYEKKK